jgi:hypothetical protein
MLQVNLEHLRTPEYLAHPYRFKLIGGFLEKVLEGSRQDPRRVNLIWGNLHFGPGKKQRRRRSHIVNAYLDRYPEELDCLRDLVAFSKAHLAAIEKAKDAKKRGAK